MHRTFKLAFKDYPIPFELTRDEFVIKFIEKLNINFSLSAGAYNKDLLIGFLFNSIENYEEKLTAYNGGTGVIPGYRRLGVASNLYHQLIAPLKESRVQQCVLEVLTKNNAAIRLYEKIGFQKVRLLNCYKLYSIKFDSKSKEFLVETGVSLPKEYRNWLTYNPSFLDSPAMLNRYISTEKILLARDKESIVGFMVIQTSNGRISTFGIHPEKGAEIGFALVKKGLEISRNKQLTILNIDENSDSMSTLLESIGFKNEISQYEMQMDLTT